RRAARGADRRSRLIAFHAARASGASASLGRRIGRFILLGTAYAVLVREFLSRTRRMGRMAQAKRKTRGKSSRKKSSRSRTTSRKTGLKVSGARASARRGNGRGQDAIALLKADHRQVEDWFEQFEKSRSDEKKQDLATKICRALNAHTVIEEEIFYPAFLEATGETDIHHEAEIEHDGAKKLIAEIEASSPDDEYFEPKVSVLSEMIKHHVNEEEKRGGMFAKAKQSEMDLMDLGEQLARRKDEVMAEIAGESEERPMVAPELLRRGRRSRQESLRRGQ